MWIKNLPSILTGDNGGGRKLARKQLFQEIFTNPTKWWVFLRKRAWIQVQSKQVGKDSPFIKNWQEEKEKTNRKKAQSGGRRQCWGAWLVGEESSTSAGKARGLWVWAMAGLWQWDSSWVQLLQEREEEHEEEERESWGEKEGLVLKLNFCKNYNFAAVFFEP